MSDPKERIAKIKEAFDKRLPDVESALPEAIKGKADWFIKQALLTIAGSVASPKTSLSVCTLGSLESMLLMSASTGLVINNKLAYASKRNVNVAPPGQPKVWESRAQFTPSYIGMVSAAKRCKSIVECWTDVVCEGEFFDAYKTIDGHYLKHIPSTKTDRAENIVGAYAVFCMPNGMKLYEYLNALQIEKLKGFSQSVDIWNTHPIAMFRKCPVRQGLKLLCDDPWLAEILEADDATYDLSTEKPTNRSALNDTLFQGAKDGQPTASSGAA